MAEMIELPQSPSGKPEEQLQKVYSYLYQLAENLNRNLAEIGGGALNDSEMAIMRGILNEGQDPDAVQMAMNEAESLKSLIIKTASWVQNKMDMYRLKLLGEYVADGTFGKYVRHTGLDVDITPTGVTQNYTFEEVIQGLRTYEINSKNYIKSGLLYTDGTTHLPVYGVAVGKDIVTFSQDGTEIYNDSNKVAMFTADELSFWQNGNKSASYKANRIDFNCGGENLISITPEKIAFLYDGVDLLYSLQDKLYAAGDFEISQGNKLIVDSTDDIEINGQPVISDIQDDIGDIEIFMVDIEEEVDGKISKTIAYQTADAIVTEAEWQAATAAGIRYLAKTQTYQTADAIVTAAQTYVNGQLASYSTTTQTSAMISQAVGDCYGKVSGITIEAAGIDISGSQYVHIASGGNIWIRRPGNSTNAVVIDNAGIGIYTGAAIDINGGSVTIKSGNSNAVYMDSAGIGIYSGADIEIMNGGDFVVKSGGDVIIESGGTFAILNNAGTGNAVVMDRYGIDVYSGAAVTIQGGTVAIKSGNSNAIYMDSAGIGIYSGADIEIMNGGDFVVKSGGDVLIESGGTFTIKNYAGTGNAVYMDRYGIGIYSGAAIDISGGTLAIKSGNTNAVYMDSTGIGVYSGADISIHSGGDLIVESGGDVLIESGGSFTIKNYAGTGNAIYMDRYGIGIYSGAEIEIMSGGSLTVVSGGEFYLASNGMIIDSANDVIQTDKWHLNATGMFYNDTQDETVDNVTTTHNYRFEISNYYAANKHIFRYTDVTTNKQVGIVMEFHQDTDTIEVYRAANTGYLFFHLYELHVTNLEATHIIYGDLTQSSSRDVKKDIKPIEPAGERLDRLEPVSFIYKDDPDEKTHQGLIYEDTVEIMPEICTDVERDKIKGISYIELVPILLREIQELRARVKALEEQNAEV